MKCKTVQHWILLAGTGELSIRRRRKLDTHVADCTTCRQWREAYAAIETRAHEAMMSGSPSESVLVNIRREARVQATQGRPAARLTLWLRPAYGVLAAVTLCLMVIAGWWLRPHAHTFGEEAQLSAILLMLSDDTNMWVQTDSALPAPPSLESLAQALLLLQGLNEDVADLELTDSGEAHPATDPLSRNSYGPQARRYG